MRGQIKLEIDHYRDFGLVPSGFITAVLCNELFNAWDCADAQNWQDLKNIIHYLQEHVPNGAYGDRQAVARWLLHQGMKGLQSQTWQAEDEQVS